MVTISLACRADPDGAAPCADAAHHGWCVSAWDAGGGAVGARCSARSLPLPGPAFSHTHSLPQPAA